jgi:DNA-binding transcriptional LysR family regulator
MNIGYVMELRDLEYFVVVAEHGNLGRAAEVLGLSPPALSKSLRRLEGALQVKLFQRNAKGMDLTAEGSLLLLRARELRQSLRNVAREVSDVSRGHAGHINLGVGPVVNDQFLLPAVAQLLREQPRVTMKVIVSDADEIMPPLMSGQLDLVINILWPAPPTGLAYIPLYEDEYVVGCASNHRLANRSHISLAELSQQRWAMSEPSLPTHEHLRKTFQDNGLEPPRIAFESRSLKLRMEVAASSDMLLYMSKTVLSQSDARSAGLRALAVPELRWLRAVGAIHREEPYMGPAVRQLVKILYKTVTSAELDWLNKEKGKGQDKASLA